MSERLRALARRLAPTVYLDAREPYWPCTVKDYAKNCELWRGEVKVSDSATPELLAAHDTPDAKLVLAPAGRAGSRDPVAYPGGVEVYADIRENSHAGFKTVEIVYYLYFAFNGTAVSHYGDRERVIVTADDRGNPLEVFFSSHSGGYWKSWKSRDVELPGTGNGGCAVYVCRESHAMSAKPGVRPRLFGMGNDVCSPAAEPLPYKLRFVTDVPLLAWKGKYNGKDPFLPDRGWSPRTKCTPDTLAVFKTKLPPAAVDALLAGTAAGIFGLAFLAAWTRRWWVLAPAVPLAGLLVLAWGMLGTDDLPWKWN